MLCGKGGDLEFLHVLKSFLSSYVFSLYFFVCFISSTVNLGFPGGSVVKNPPANVGYMGSIPGSEDPLEKEMAPLSSIPAWTIP